MEKRTYKSKYTKEKLLPIAQQSFSIADVLRKLGLKQTGGNYANINGWIRHYNIDITHFTGKFWAKGLTKESNCSISSMAKSLRYSDEQVFIKDSRPISGSKLTKRLLKLEWAYKCSICEIDSWLGSSLTLHLDHINGVHTDNRLENLRFLCPNCHQQTDTWGNKTSVASCKQ